MNDYLPRWAAAAVLGRSPHTIKRWARFGLVRTARDDRGQALVHREDVVREHQRAAVRRRHASTQRGT